MMLIRWFFIVSRILGYLLSSAEVKCCGSCMYKHAAGLGYVDLPAIS